MDNLGSEYGWSKEQILNLYPREMEILNDWIARRREITEDRRMLQLIHAARVPMMKDGGASIINSINLKHEVQDQKYKDVTPETIAKEMEIAQRIMQRV